MDPAAAVIPHAQPVRRRPLQESRMPPRRLVESLRSGSIGRPRWVDQPADSPLFSSFSAHSSGGARPQRRIPVMAAPCGIFYLYMKTAERAHLPKKLWERVKLPKSYDKATEVIQKYLEHWPKLLVLKIRQRLLKMTQYRIRMRNLQLKVREKIMTVPRKKTQRDLQRLEKAEKAAQLDKSIENELIERLRKGVYGGEIPNVPFKPFNTILDMDNDDLAPEIEEEEEGEIEYVEGADIDMGEMEDMEDFECFGGEDDDGNDGLDEPFTKNPKRSGSDMSSKIGRKSTKVIAEVEQDEDRNRRLSMRM